jgi:hypothetical protein
MMEREYILARNDHGTFGPFSRFHVTETIMKPRPVDAPVSVWSIWDAEKFDDICGLWGAQVFSTTSTETPNGLTACKEWIQRH